MFCIIAFSLILFCFWALCLATSGFRINFIDKFDNNISDISDISDTILKLSIISLFCSIFSLVMLNFVHFLLSSLGVTCVPIAKVSLILGSFSGCILHYFCLTVCAARIANILYNYYTAQKLKLFFLFIVCLILYFLIFGVSHI